MHRKGVKYEKKLGIGDLVKVDLTKEKDSDSFHIHLEQNDTYQWEKGGH